MRKRPGTMDAWKRLVGWPVAVNRWGDSSQRAGSGETVVG